LAFPLQMSSYAGWRLRKIETVLGLGLSIAAVEVKPNLLVRADVPGLTSWRVVFCGCALSLGMALHKASARRATRDLHEGDMQMPGLVYLLIGGFLGAEQNLEFTPAAPARRRLSLSGIASEPTVRRPPSPPRRHHCEARSW
jgi:hypothetical protein